MSMLEWLPKLNYPVPLAIAAPMGEMAELKVLPLDRLVIDPRYQRDIAEAGRRNIRHIVEHFDWALFTPVIVTPVAGGLYAIIDGQHRAAAANLHPHVTKVPCAITTGDLAAQARAFVGINDRVTRLNGFQIYAAQLAAGDDAARQVARACKTAGVEIPAYPIPRDKLKRGQTLAIGAIKTSIVRHGIYKVTLAMTALAAGDADGLGLVNRDTILGMVEAIVALGRWALDNDLFLARMAKIDLPKLDDAAALARLSEAGTAAAHFNRLLVDECRERGWGPSLAPKPRRGRGSY